MPLLLASGYIGFAQYAGYLWPLLATDAHAQGVVAAAIGILTLALLYRPIGAVAATSFAFAAIAIATVGAVIAAALTHLNAAQAFSFEARGRWLVPALVAGLGPALVITLYDYLGYAQSCFFGRGSARAGTRPAALDRHFRSGDRGPLRCASNRRARRRALAGARARKTVDGAAPAESFYVAATVLERTWGVWAARIGTIAILITAFASTFGNLLGASRIPYAAAVDGVFLKPFAALERSRALPATSRCSHSVCSRCRPASFRSAM